MDFYSIPTLRSIFGPRTFSKKKVFYADTESLKLTESQTSNQYHITLQNRNSFQRLSPWLQMISQKTFFESSNYLLIRNVEDYSCMKFKAISLFMNVDSGRPNKMRGGNNSSRSISRKTFCFCKCQNLGELRAIAPLLSSILYWYLASKL